MAKVIASFSQPQRHIGTIPVTVWELVWDDGGRSFEVARDDTGQDLTEDGCFDTVPSDDEIRSRLNCQHEDMRVDDRNQFHCRTCGEWLGR